MIVRDVLIAGMTIGIMHGPVNQSLLVEFMAVLVANSYVIQKGVLKICPRDSLIS